MLASRMIGSNGPSPPREEPVSAFTMLVSGDDAVPSPPGLASVASVRLGAVDCARSAAMRPSLPCSSSARSVEELSAPLEEPGPLRTAVLLGWLPFAVGKVSSNWLTPEFPTGATVRAGATARALAGIATDRSSPTTTRLIEHRLRANEAPEGQLDSGHSGVDGAAEVEDVLDLARCKANPVYRGSGCPSNGLDRDLTRAGYVDLRLR